jgi:hypothetical protein
VTQLKLLSLSGAEQVQIETDSDGILLALKCLLDFGAAIWDHRGLVLNPGS